MLAPYSLLVVPLLLPAYTAIYQCVRIGARDTRRIEGTHSRKSSLQRLYIVNVLGHWLFENVCHSHRCPVYATHRRCRTYPRLHLLRRRVARAWNYFCFRLPGLDYFILSFFYYLFLLFCLNYVCFRLPGPLWIYSHTLSPTHTNTHMYI